MPRRILSAQRKAEPMQVSGGCRAVCVRVITGITTAGYTRVGPIPHGSAGMAQLKKLFDPNQKATIGCVPRDDFAPEARMATMQPDDFLSRLVPAMPHLGGGFAEPQQVLDALDVLSERADAAGLTVTAARLRAISKLACAETVEVRLAGKI